ncbi:cobalt-precorrin-6A reductase [Kineosporia succinea]|uniref:Precorrin-6A/cobalt-precorrin-6A reductase n=1 Tax=Kineosporia succinea TaxID=84632 RepID=A0ABT9P5A3_9ACTN|nr:cobalt-precorrin-6A reductase [Kineosporia succinea]MDP9827657.1 precorrin-6A/cobalt-precorrin-6A reductase [Kineosporia succinea]
MGRVLILGGTGEGRELAAALTASGVSVVSSLAGRVSSPRLPPGDVRVGGFGGVTGLRGFLVDEGISAVVDATHPFAERITANAAEAAEGVPLLILSRPAWVAQPGDRWNGVPTLEAAADRVAGTDASSNIMLTTGRQETAPFAPLPQRFWLRAVETPDGPLPRRCEVILDRGPFTLDGERELLAGKDILVTKNSGGPMTAAKLTAARELGLEVVMVERPPLPEGVPVVHDVRSAVDWALNAL